MTDIGSTFEPFGGSEFGEQPFGLTTPQVTGVASATLGAVAASGTGAFSASIDVAIGFSATSATGVINRTTVILGAVVDNHFTSSGTGSHVIEAVATSPISLPKMTASVTAKYRKAHVATVYATLPTIKAAVTAAAPIHITGAVSYHGFSATTTMSRSTAASGTGVIPCILPDIQAEIYPSAGYMATKLLSLLPAIHRNRNADPDAPEYGCLSAFLASPAMTLDQMLYQIYNLPSLWNPMTINARHLPLLAAKFGATINPLNTLGKERERIRDIVASYQRRGKQSQLEWDLGLAGFDGTVSVPATSSVRLNTQGALTTDGVIGGKITNMGTIRVDSLVRNELAEQVVEEHRPAGARVFWRQMLAVEMTEFPAITDFNPTHIVAGQASENSFTTEFARSGILWALLAPDANGEFVLGGTHYTFSDTPTKILLCSIFDFPIGVGEWTHIGIYGSGTVNGVDYASSYLPNIITPWAQHGVYDQATNPTGEVLTPGICAVTYPITALKKTRSHYVFCGVYFDVSLMT